MRTESILRNARVVLRADAIIADIHLRALVARSGLQVVAVLVGLFGAVMLGIAAFLALERAFGPIVAAVIVGGGALVVAAIVWVVAAGIAPGRDLELAQQLRDSATEALVADLREAEADLAGFTRVLRNPLDGALPGLIIPLAGILLKSLRRPPHPPAAGPG